MANPTVLQFKTAVAAQLGKTNATVAVPKRDEAIKSAIIQYIGESPWRWNRKTVTITPVNGSASTPTDFSTDFEASVYTYSGTFKRSYAQVDREDIYRFPSGTFAWALEAGTLYFPDNTPVQLSYQAIAPTLLLNGSDDAVVLPFPDLTTPSQLAIGKYWLAAERDEDEYDRFARDVYKPLLRRDILRDKASGPAYWNNKLYQNRDLGFNRQSTILR